VGHQEVGPVVSVPLDPLAAPYVVVVAAAVAAYAVVVAVAVAVVEPFLSSLCDHS